MYQRILVPLDGSKLSEQVLPYARLLAAAQHVPMRLLRVFNPVPAEMTGPIPGQYVDRLATAFRNEATDYLEQIARPLRGDGVEISVAAHEGDAASLIVREAEQEPETLIAMCTHGRSGVGRWVLGSVTDKVLHSTTGFMLIVRADSEEGASPQVDFGTIIIPLDGSPLAEQSLPVVAALAQPLGAKVSLVRATSSLEEALGSMSFQEMGTIIGPGMPSPDELAMELDNEAITYLDKIKESLNQQGVSSVDTRVLHGNPAGAIVDAAQESSGALVAMTTHGRSGAARWILGSVTDRVVRESGDPVLVIRSS